MKIKKMHCVIALLSIILPKVIMAKNTDEYEVLSKTEKYYKTTMFENELSFMNKNQLQNYTVEITEDEYINGVVQNTSKSSTSSTIETTYKKLTTTISSNGTTYRYKAVLNWKNMPKVRSYDIIAIGHYASVTQNGNVVFSQEYCTNTTNCTTSTNFTQQKFTNGASATFKLPTGNYISLKQTLYFDVKKNVDATIIKQLAAGDYAHATKTITSNNALNATVATTGINLNSSISGYYDEISPATSTWTGNW